MKQAIKLAIEWIEKQPEETPHSKYDLNTRYVVLRELEAALAQPEQEPVAWRFQSAVGGWAYGKEPPIGSKYAVEPLYTTPPQPKEPEQEPVGKFAKFTDGIWREVTDGSAGIPLYTTPPQRTWVDLTDDEMLMIYGQKHEGKKYSLGRMVQAKLKEKNNG